MGPTELDPRNPYAAPRAELDAAPAAALPANLAAAVEGRYDFTVGQVMDEAWKLVKGMKGTFWGAAVVIGLIYLLADTISGVVFAMVLLPKAPPVVVRQLSSSVVGVLMTPFTMGLSMMCVRRALGLPISFSTAFSYFPRAGTAMVASLLILLMCCAGTLLLILPGIYLVVAYELVVQLIGDQGLSAWQAMETSRKAISHKWWSVLGLGLLVGLLTVVSALGLLIPLIWTIPWAMMTSGVLYRRIFYAPPPVSAGVPV